jgi:hypothetical protein
LSRSSYAKAGRASLYFNPVRHFYELVVSQVTVNAKPFEKRLVFGPALRAKLVDQLITFLVKMLFEVLFKRRV